MKDVNDHIISDDEELSLYSTSDTSDDEEEEIIGEVENSSQAQRASSLGHVSFGEDAFDSISKKYPEVFVWLKEQEHYDSNRGTLKLENGVWVRLSQIIALAGDFFGIPEKPISEGKSEQEKRKRFNDAYKTLAKASDAEKIVTQVNSAIEQEAQLIVARATQEPASKTQHPTASAAKALSSEQNAKYVTATKKCVEQTETGIKARWRRIYSGLGNHTRAFKYLTSNYSKLLQTNFDHFVPHAHEAYRIGHELALEAAMEAYQAKQESIKLEGDKKTEKCTEAARKLVRALSLEAFAAHYSTDAFTSAHMRVPRRELHFATKPHKTGDLWSHDAHEDDKELWVVSDIHEEGWLTCGDDLFFETESYPEACAKIEEMVTKGFTGIIEIWLGTAQLTQNWQEQQLKWQKKMWPRPTSIHKTLSDASNGGLSYQEVPEDGHHCLFRAVGLYINQKPKTLRNSASQYIKKHPDEFRDMIASFENTQRRSIKAFAKDIKKGKERTNDSEIADILMKVLNKPIIIVGPDGKIRNPEKATEFPEDFVLVYYNGHNHYDGLKLTTDYQNRSRDVLENLVQFSQRSPRTPANPSIRNNRNALFKIENNILLKRQKNGEYSKPKAATPTNANNLVKKAVWAFKHH